MYKVIWSITSVENFEQSESYWHSVIFEKRHNHPKIKVHYKIDMKVRTVQEGS